MSCHVRPGRGRLLGVCLARLLAVSALIAPSLALAQSQTGICAATPGPDGAFSFAGNCQGSSSSLIGLTGTGATGPGGSGADLFDSATDGGPGVVGPALTLELSSGALLVQSASGGNGLYFSSTGGTGGTGGHDADFRHAGDGGSGGDGGVITITIDAGTSVSTTGYNADAVFAISSGGVGGQGGADVDGGLGDGNGGPGGNGGDISIVNNGALSTSGTYSSAIFAHSDGGAGGAGAPAQSFFGNGGSGGVGGNSGADVTATNAGTASTSADNSAAVVLQSVGGNGGDGGGGEGAFYSQGGSGGNGGNGRDIEFSNSGTIQTQGDHADAVDAYSIGGGGGLIQADNATVVGGPIPIMASQAGGAGDGGAVIVGDDQHDVVAITTAGVGAHGIVAQSIGGGGTALIIDQPTAQFSINRTDGGNPNGGGDVQVILNGIVATAGANAYGIVAQSLTNATVLFGTDGIEIVQEPTPSRQGAVQVLLQVSVATSGSGTHGIVTYMNATNGVGGTPASTRPPATPRCSRARPLPAPPIPACRVAAIRSGSIR